MATEFTVVGFRVSGMFPVVDLIPESSLPKESRGSSEEVSYDMVMDESSDGRGVGDLAKEAEGSKVRVAKAEFSTSRRDMLRPSSRAA